VDETMEMPKLRFGAYSTTGRLQPMLPIFQRTAEKQHIYETIRKTIPENNQPADSAALDKDFQNYMQQNRELEQSNCDSTTYTE